jgi:hypothetical protein
MTTTPLNFVRNATNRLFLVVLFSLLSVVTLESVAAGYLLDAPKNGAQVASGKFEQIKGVRQIKGAIVKGSGYINVNK